MAFHVSCPITCRRICYCKLGFPPELRSERGQNEFLEATARVEEILKNPSVIYGKPKTVQVLVPKVVATPPPPPPTQAAVTPNVAAAVDGDRDAEELLSAQTKRVAIQKKAALSVVAEDYARRYESGDMSVGFHKDFDGDEQGLSNAKVTCSLCFSCENEGSDRARKMLSCKSCSKKYHRSCVKSWAQNRDLFHWSSWTCPSCRTCEVCRKTGDPHKLMFCKRCDSAYHCYCQQPPHKNVSSGPYLCPKHTRCHSCSSTVPGNGLSVRWFLGYTCCDACGRLFVKGNYCPVCLKVYRDSESTPMVCCDICQRWVHCQCDGISDEKYLQYQVDNNLEYRCATCRGECYQVRDHEDAIQELWRRRDKADLELTASLRAAAGLPTEENIFSIQPYSDDEDNGPSSKNEYDSSLKFSCKGVVDKSPKKSKEYVKKSASKKYGKKMGFHAPVFGGTEPRIEGHSDSQSTGFIIGDNKDGDVQSYRSEEAELLSLPVANISGVGVWSNNQAGVPKKANVNEVPVKMGGIIRDNGSLGEDTHDETVKPVDKSMTTKGPKLVIHLGAKNKSIANSPKSDASNLLGESELITSNGKNLDHADQPKGLKFKGKEGNTIKIRKLNPENSDVYNVSGILINKQQLIPPVKAHTSAGKRSTERSGVRAGLASETRAIRGHMTSDDLNDGNRDLPPVRPSAEKELKPLLRLKLKNTYSDNHTSWASSGEDDKSSVKGQRSKRKRPSPFLDKSSIKEDEGPGELYGAFDPIDHEIMDANWIIHTLGKDAIGKKVEVHQSSNNTWHKGTVIEVFEGTSIVSVASEDGTASNVNLRKQGIRFDSQKQRR